MRVAFLFLFALWALRAENVFDQAVRKYQGHDLESARRDFLNVVQSAPPALPSRYYLGRIALAEGKPAEAVRWLEPVVSQEPPFLDSTSQLAKAYVATGELAKARDLLTQALRAAEWDGSLHYRLGRIYQQMGETGLMKQEFAASARLKSADQEAVIKISECAKHLAEGRKQDAVEIRQQFLEDAKLDPDALVALGKIFTDAGLQVEALDLFKTAARRDPASFEAQYDLGLGFLNFGKTEEAQGVLEPAVRLQPHSRDANAALALAYAMNEKYAAAVPILESMPKSPRIVSLLGLAYLRTGEAAKAVPLLRAAAGESKDPKTYFLLIEGLNAIEDQAGALAAAETACQRFPELPRAHLARGQQLARMGRYSEALPDFQKALSLAPGDVDAQLGLADILQKQGDYERSLAAYEELVRRNHDNIAAQLGVARNLIFLRQFEQAREQLETWVREHPDDAQLRFELSRVYARLGDRDRAAEQTRILQQLRRRDASPQ
jgi:tetratricopeptide (TPR) repeat protein